VHHFHVIETGAEVNLSSPMEEDEPGSRWKPRAISRWSPRWVPALVKRMWGGVAAWNRKLRQRKVAAHDVGRRDFPTRNK